MTIIILYIIICWLFGGGVSYSLWKKDKDSGEDVHFLQPVVFTIAMPIFLPIALGVSIGDKLDT